MNETKPTEILASLAQLLPKLQTIYKDIHAHPELSMQETRTAGIAAKHLKAMGFKVTTGVGKTGVVGILRNGGGATVMLRADMDALPIKEATGLSYASIVTATGSDGKATPSAMLLPGKHKIHQHNRTATEQRNSTHARPSGSSILRETTLHVIPAYL